MKPKRTPTPARYILATVYCTDMIRDQRESRIVAIAMNRADALAILKALNRPQRKVK